MGMGSHLDKELLKGKSARAVGLVFIAAPICAFALWAFMYESFVKAWVSGLHS